jgi:hypothetical protein
MRSFPENFECLILGEADFGVPKIVGHTIIIPVMHLPVHAYGRHPLVLTDDKAFWKHPALGEVVDGLLVFRDVYLSRRKIIEYIGDPMHPDGFREPYVVEDINVDVGDEILNTYDFEGSLEDPPAFVETWDILARSFELQVD